MIEKYIRRSKQIGEHEIAAEMERLAAGRNESMREFAARINAGENINACEYCGKTFGDCNCNCIEEFEIRDLKHKEG